MPLPCEPDWLYLFFKGGSRYCLGGLQSLDSSPLLSYMGLQLYCIIMCLNPPFYAERLNCRSFLRFLHPELFHHCITHKCTYAFSQKWQAVSGTKVPFALGICKSGEAQTKFRRATAPEPGCALKTQWKQECKSGYINLIKGARHSNCSADHQRNSICSYINWKQGFKFRRFWCGSLHKKSTTMHVSISACILYFIVPCDIELF